MKNITIGVIGAGTMGVGIAQVAASAGHTVIITDSYSSTLAKAKISLENLFNNLVAKNKITAENATDIVKRINFVTELTEFRHCELIIEAVIENLSVKKELFAKLAQIVSTQAILATNTSSLSVTSIASAINEPARFIGIHFFNPAALMPLVEIVPALQTATSTVQTATNLIQSWGKTTVLAKDTPGFIVNRVARPFYGEAIRILEEGIADISTIDWAITTIGGFRMGPFTLMDYIGNDINYIVTETVFQSFFYDPRYKPSFTQKRLVEAGYLGRKTGRGYYNYSDQNTNPISPNKDIVLGQKIVERVVAMLINEAIDALFWQVATKEDLDLAMTKGVNYPKGLLRWADEWGAKKVYDILNELQIQYGEDRYRPSALLRKMAIEGSYFYQ